MIQPMLDGIFDAGERGLVTAHFLVDAITSASAGSGAANGTPFTERRYEAGGGYTHELDGPRGSWVDKIRIGGDAKYSTESDYTSLYGGVRVEADVAQKNATIGLGVGYSADNADNAGAQGPMGGPPLVCNSLTPTITAASCAVDTFGFNASASQIVGRNAVVALTYDLGRIHGFQSNAYRTVVTEGGLLPESHPDERLRQAITASARIYVPATHTTFIPVYRYYRDNWDIHAHTPELRIVQEVGAYADATIRYRYYRQSAAYFYEARYGMIDPTTGALHHGRSQDVRVRRRSDGGQARHLRCRVRALGQLGGRAIRRHTDVHHPEQSVRERREAQIALTYPFDY